MVRSAFSTETVSKYITSLEKTGFATGLLFGQSSLGKDYIIHACITPCRSEDQPEAINKKAKKMPDNINNVNENWVADHARHASRMLPGGMYVLGIFIVSDENLLSVFSPKIKSILHKLHQQLSSSKYLYGNADNEKLVLNFSTKSQQYSCKTFDASSSHVSPADFKILTNSNSIKWQNLECKYEVDFLYHIRKNETGSAWNLKSHMNVILDKVDKKLNTALFLFNGEMRDGDECLENINKKKVLRKTGTNYKEQSDDLKAIQVSIFESCNGTESENEFECYQAGGQIRIVGQVASKVWLNPKVSIKVASNAVVEDIMRSLATRLEMHWDSLTEEEHSEDISTIHEPPRRVFIPIVNTDITVSDYLFPGESSPDLIASLKDLLGITALNLKDVQDIEGQADLGRYTDVLESESEEALPKLPTDTNKFMYMIGLGVALLVLILSLLIHFFKQ